MKAMATRPILRSYRGEARWTRYLVEHMKLNGTVALAAINQGADQGIRHGEGLAQASIWTRSEMTANASPSPTFAARFSDGRTAATNRRRCRFSATGLVIRAPGHDEATTWPCARLRTAQPLSSRSTDVLVTDRANEGATLFVTSAGFVRELSARASHLTAGSMRWQHARPWVIFGGVTAVIVGAFWSSTSARPAPRPDCCRIARGRCWASRSFRR